MKDASCRAAKPSRAQTWELRSKKKLTRFVIAVLLLRVFYAVKIVEKEVDGTAVINCISHIDIASQIEGKRSWLPIITNTSPSSDSATMR
ncbi:hypothetical protein EVG20_g1528 [Dentipellis fragilis]|uniref:Uncharacterized protein n=1 Tax=Dentipellis fragilis TaxID=205917 RepID=A0A4Y9ZCF4_9AGAM|nr:hypothetical protein EVG20_g1528 [Dentipellis fragilis]